MLINVFESGEFFTSLVDKSLAIAVLLGGVWYLYKQLDKKDKIIEKNGDEKTALVSKILTKKEGELIGENKKQILLQTILETSKKTNGEIFILGKNQETLKSGQDDIKKDLMEIKLTKK